MRYCGTDIVCGRDWKAGKCATPDLVLIVVKGGMQHIESQTVS